MTIDRWIISAAKKWPEKCAIAFHGSDLTYADFARLISVRAGQLRARGLEKGDRVGWLGFNHPEVFVLLFACARIGAILVPLNWRLADAEIEAILEDCAPKTVFHDEKMAERAGKLSSAAAEIFASSGDEFVGSSADETDPLLIVYTSGSTGKPKGVVLAQEALVANAEMSVEAHGLVPSDRVLNVLPLFHVGGLNILPTPAFSIGATVVLHAVFDPTAMLAELSEVQAAITVPTVLQAVMKQQGWADENFSSLRVLSIGSTDVPRELISAVEERGIPLIQVYGATETSPFAIYQTVENHAETSGSIGRVGLACEVSLRRPDGHEVPSGEPGEIWVRGKNTLREYWKNPAQTEDAIVGGWFRTGDVARVDESGTYWFTDRIKHIIISGGENIYPAEIERVLRKCPGVAEVSVVGMPNAKWGETPVAVLVGEPGVDPLEFLTGKIARYKMPSRVEYVDALPRNAMGKVVADDVKAMLREV